MSESPAEAQGRHSTRFSGNAGAPKHSRCDRVEALWTPSSCPLGPVQHSIKPQPASTGAPSMVCSSIHARWHTQRARHQPGTIGLMSRALLPTPAIPWPGPLPSLLPNLPGSVMASTLTRKYFPQAVPRSTLSAAAGGVKGRAYKRCHQGEGRTNFYGYMGRSSNCLAKMTGATPCHAPYLCAQGLRHQVKRQVLHAHTAPHHWRCTSLCALQSVQNARGCQPARHSLPL